MRRVVGILLAAVLAAFAAPAAAQTYPTRPIKLLVAYPPGGASDLIARLFAEGLSRRVGQPVVVENRAGANGSVAGEATAHAEPDGYTLLLGPSALFAINPHLYAHMPIDPLKELDTGPSLVENELVLAANPKLTAGMDFTAFIALARNARPPLFYASIGNGSEHHLAMELLKRAANVDLTHIPYKGGGPAAIGVMGGSAIAMFGGGSVVSLIKSGQLHALAVTGAKRSPCCPSCRPSRSSIRATRSRCGRACSRPPARRTRSWRACGPKPRPSERSPSSRRSLRPPAPASHGRWATPSLWRASVPTTRNSAT